MWSSSRSHDRRSSASGERRCAHGSRLRGLAFRPALVEPEERPLPGTPQAPSQRHGTRSTLLAAAVNVSWTIGTASAAIAPILGLTWAGLPTAARAPEGPPGSGVVVRAEVTAIGMPRALRDRARHQAGSPADCTPEELQADLARDGWRTAWYALTYRMHRVNGESEEITQIRRLSEAADHLDELRAVMAVAAGRPPRSGREAFSHTTVVIIPDALRAVDPREAITRILAERAIGDDGSPKAGLDSPRRSRRSGP